MTDDFSDGVDEFASNFENDVTTTPFRSVKLDAQAGPSNRQTNGGLKRRRSPDPVDTDAGESEAAQPSIAPRGSRPLRPRKGSREPEPIVPAKNAKKPPSLRKGKGNAKDAAERYPSPALDELDTIREESIKEAPPQSAKRDGPSKHDTSKHAAMKLHKENITLAKKVEELTTQRDRLAHELEEMNHLQYAELQENMEILRDSYESRINIQETLIKEFTSHIARMQPELSGDKIHHSLHFLTREAADMELRDVDKELERVRSMLSDKDVRLKEQEERIRLLESDLKVEVENYKRLAARQANPFGSITMSKSQPAVSVKQSQVVRLYEDMTNLLVTDVKIEESDGADVVSFRCIYTHPDSRNSISFTLRMNEDPENPGEDNMKVLYTADSDTLAEMTPEMRQNLDFLADTFTFQRQQMDAFYENLSEAFGK